MKSRNRTLRAWFLFLPALAVISCTYDNSVPGDAYGVLVHMGEVKRVVSGPATVETEHAMEAVVIIPRKERVVFNSRGGEIVPVTIRIYDPKQYYLATQGQAATLIFAFNPKLKQMSRTDAAAYLISALNKPENGIRAESEAF